MPRLTDTATRPPSDDTTPVKHDRAALSYSGSFENPLKRRVIQAIEWMTGKVSIIRMVRIFEKRPPARGQAFWRAALDVMRIELRTPDEQVAHIPQKGPVVLVANHPHGLVDGMVLAELVGRRRDDYRILTRSLLTGLDPEASNYMIPVPFPHESNAQQKMVAMREAAMAHLAEGGMVALFPSGVVAASETMFGPAVEAEWNVFTAKMIRKSGAVVVPCYFPGENSRWYQMANQISSTLRQGLLLHEIVHAAGKPQAPVIGPPIAATEIEARITRPREFMAWLRGQVLGMKAGNT